MFRGKKMCVRFRPGFLGGIFRRCEEVQGEVGKAKEGSEILKTHPLYCPIFDRAEDNKESYYVKDRNFLQTEGRGK